MTVEIEFNEEEEEDLSPPGEEQEFDLSNPFPEEETTIAPTTATFLQSIQDSLGTVRSSLGFLAPGINIYNKTPYPILFMLSQLSPLHWCKVDPGERKHLQCGQVLFTVSVEVYDPATVPTVESVAARIATISAATIFTGGLIGMGIVGTASAFTSFKPVHRHGILANGRTVVVKSSVNEFNIPLLAIIVGEDDSLEDLPVDGNGAGGDTKISGATE